MIQPHEIKIMIADDHPVLSAGLSRILQEKGYQVLFTAANGQELINKIPVYNPHLVLMDVDMEVMNGIEATKVIKQKFPQIRILAMSMHQKKSVIEEMLQVGAAGYFLKNESEDELDEAIRLVMNGKMYISEKVNEILYVKGSQSGLLGNNKNSIHFSDRELAVLSAIAEGKTTEEIASELNISPRTVETHRGNLLTKSGARNVAQLVRYAITNNLI